MHHGTIQTGLEYDLSLSIQHHTKSLHLFRALMPRDQAPAGPPNPLITLSRDALGPKKPRKEVSVK